ncbi:hypothetical protein Tco_0436761, partial [Tanacetum coccineum]
PAPYTYRLNCVDFLFDPIIVAAEASWRGNFTQLRPGPYRPEPYRYPLNSVDFIFECGF